jgi:hypothetical protein
MAGSLGIRVVSHHLNDEMIPGDADAVILLVSGIVDGLINFVSGSSMSHVMLVMG